MAENENPGDDWTTLRLRIEGSVQGVGYRFFAADEARKLRLDGWIRNRSDGSVEALVSGPTKTVESFVAICMRGPPGARVTNVDMHTADPPAEQGFRIRATV
ncbi:MAG TPA: acylphosphatase [Rhizomicrobium sp.]|jgi:acylphosphatase|nr:acylphosphatase [Rhizomicrobium sp.]